MTWLAYDDRKDLRRSAARIRQCCVVVTKLTRLRLVFVSRFAPQDISLNMGQFGSITLNHLARHMNIKLSFLTTSLITGLFSTMAYGQFDAGSKRLKTGRLFESVMADVSWCQLTTCKSLEPGNANIDESLSLSHDLCI